MNIPMDQDVRREAYELWNETVASVSKFGETVLPPEALPIMRNTLRDIPLRDALLCTMARADNVEPWRVLFTRLAQTGEAPSVTFLASINYIEGDAECASNLVSEVLQAEEYSLARLLHNGLLMRTPASTLKRSFTHFYPEDLLKG